MARTAVLSFTKRTAHADVYRSRSDLLIDPSPALHVVDDRAPRTVRLSSLPPEGNCHSHSLPRRQIGLCIVRVESTRSTVEASGLAEGGPTEVGVASPVAWLARSSSPIWTVRFLSIPDYVPDNTPEREPKPRSDRPLQRCRSKGRCWSGKCRRRSGEAGFRCVDRNRRPPRSVFASSSPLLEDGQSGFGRLHKSKRRLMLCLASSTGSLAAGVCLIQSLCSGQCESRHIQFSSASVDLAFSIFSRGRERGPPILRKDWDQIEQVLPFRDLPPGARRPRLGRAQVIRQTVRLPGSCVTDRHNSFPPVDTSQGLNRLPSRRPPSSSRIALRPLPKA